MSERTSYPSIGETIDGYLERQESAIESIKTEDEIEDIAYEILS